MTTVVEMIGAGPGDPDLLTLRAEAALAAATVVVVDAEVAHLAAAFSPAASVSISAAGGGAAVDGDAVRILTGAARRDERVVRLYRGDPWLHPAYAVESALLASAGVDHVAVPGPSVELAAPAAAGLAVHHRPLAVTLTTADPAALPPAVDPARTLVALVDDAAAAAAGLLRDGDPALPAAVVRLGRDGVAVAHRGTLASLAADPAAGGGVLVVGAVAGGESGSLARPVAGTESATDGPAAVADIGIDSATDGPAAVADIGMDSATDGPAAVADVGADTTTDGPVAGTDVGSVATP